MAKAPFQYSVIRPARKHGPEGYHDYQRYKPWLRDEFSFRCGYCLQRELFAEWGWRNFRIDHRIPRSIDETLETEYSNLVYSCERCNCKKSNHVLPDPLTVDYGQELVFNENGTVSSVGKNGQYIIDILHLDDPDLVARRSRLFETIRLFEQKAAGMPTVEADRQLAKWLGFPSHLPWLRRVSVPRNTRRSGIEDCYYEQRRRGTLPVLY